MDAKFVEYGTGHKLAIYGARNAAVAQRLEGYIHISPDLLFLQQKMVLNGQG